MAVGASRTHRVTLQGLSVSAPVWLATSDSLKETKTKTNTKETKTKAKTKESKTQGKTTTSEQLQICSKLQNNFGQIEQQDWARTRQASAINSLCKWPFVAVCACLYFVERKTNIARIACSVTQYCQEIVKKKFQNFQKKLDYHKLSKSSNFVKNCQNCKNKNTKESLLGNFLTFNDLPYVPK